MIRSTVRSPAAESARKRRSVYGLDVRRVAYLLIVAMVLQIAAPSRNWAMLAPVDIPLPAAANSRSQDLRTIQTALESKMVRQRLRQLGLSDKEVELRLNRLSDGDVHEMASRIHALRPAGEGEFVGILVVVLLVVLIIYLIRRI